MFQDLFENPVVGIGLIAGGFFIFGYKTVALILGIGAVALALFMAMGE